MDLMTLQARLLLDSSQYEQGLDNSEKRATSFGSKLKKGLGAVAKVGGIALAAAGAATVAIGKKAFDAYANYEQLAGGVETLFGTGGLSLEEYAAKQGKSVDKVRKKYELLQAGQSAVMENAAQAWKTSGMSMNDYMETVTGFSAALVKSTGGDTVRAARYADMAMTDMSDNANKMGTDISMIQSAYQGFAKQNYTMLDNLKLGYGGTKTEMQRLIKDANKLRKKMGLKPNLNIKNYADIVEAIHLIQEEMGIMGTTAKEADSTIQGSTLAMKAAWQNLLLGISDDNQDFGALVDNFIGSFTTVSNNVMPRVKIILEGLGKLFEAFADTILPAIIDILLENAPQLVGTAAKLLTTLATALVKALPTIIRAVPQIIIAIVDTLKENWDEIKQAGADAIQAIAEGITGESGDSGSVGKAIGALAMWLLNKLWQLVLALGKWLTETAFPAIWEKAKSALASIWEYLKESFAQVWSDIKRAAGMAWESIKGTLAEKWEAIKESFATAWNAIVEWVAGAWESFKTGVSTAWDAIKQFFVGVWESIKENAVTAWNNITTALSGVWESIKTAGSTFGTTVKTFFANTWESVKKTAAEKWGAIKESISGVWDNIKTTAGEKIESIKTSVSEKFIAIKEDILGTFETLKTNVGEKWEAIKEKISGFIEKIKALFNFEWKFPEIKLPHIYVKEYMTILGAKVPKKLGVSWYKKAYDEPYLFTTPTIVGNRGFGDGGGSGEMVYGRDALMNDIREAVGWGQPPVINIYQREGEDTMALSKRIEQDLIKLMSQNRAGALYV